MSTTNRIHRCRAWSALADLAGLFRIFSGTLANSYRPDSTTCADPDPSGEPSIGRRFDSAFRRLLSGCPRGLDLVGTPGSADGGRRLRHTFFGQV